ncbi:MAG TPA: dual specificity protein phosphatase [Anaerolineales bacterium]|nr:dual specificity protein phosphatase [Anaerolineales bacterium]
MNFSPITDSLYIGTTPSASDYFRLRGLNVALVINLRVERPPIRDRYPQPLKTLWLPVFDTPLVPIPIYALNKGVRAALEVIQQGRVVYVHCAAGVHRAPALGSAILIAQGYSAEQAMRTIKERRPIADPHAWYIRRRILRFAKNWNPPIPLAQEADTMTK